MKVLKLRTICTSAAFIPMLGCVSLEVPRDTSQRYEADTGSDHSFDRIHDNIDVRGYNLAAGAVAKGDKKAADRAIGNLETQGGQFNRRNAGNLRSISTCKIQRIGCVAGE